MSVTLTIDHDFSLDEGLSFFFFFFFFFGLQPVVS